MTKTDHCLIFDEYSLGKNLGLSKNYADKIETIKRFTPDGLKYLSHYALAWGIDDDGYREDFISRATDVMRKNLKWVISTEDNSLDEWLSGPEARSKDLSEAYLAFTNMRMAAYEILE